MSNIRVVYNEETREMDLYLYGDFIASWGKDVSVMGCIVPYAIAAAREIGRRDKEKEIQKALGL